VRLVPDVARFEQGSAPVPLDVTLNAAMAAGLACAFIGGFLAIRLRLPAFVFGFLLAGIAVGPVTPGYVANAGIAGQLRNWASY
jgi:CPA2 family monovalent cation:H+ antiporter-2